MTDCMKIDSLPITQRTEAASTYNVAWRARGGCGLWGAEMSVTGMDPKITVINVMV